MRWPAASLLGRLSNASCRDLLQLGTAVTLAANRPILVQGERNDHSFLLLSGCVKVVASGNEGTREALLSIRIGGDIVGEMAALSGKPRSATVITCAVTPARVIHAGELRTFLARHSDVSLALATILSERLRWANERRVDFTALTARARVSRVLVELTETYGRNTPDGRDLGAALTQAEVSSLAGVKPPTGEKALRALQCQGAVALGYRNIVVTDLAAVQAACDPR